MACRTVPELAVRAGEALRHPESTAAARVPRGRIAQYCRCLDGPAAAVRDLPGTAFLAHHRRRPGFDARRAPGRIQYHATPRRSGEHRTRCDPRPVALDPRGKRDLDYLHD